MPPRYRARNPLRQLLRREAGRDEAEFVPAEAADEVARPRHAAELFRHEGEDPVADHMTEGVVDRLEMVHVQERQRAGLPACQVGPQAVLPGAPVEHAREHVDVGLAPDCGQGRLEAGNLQ